MFIASPICFMLDTHVAWRALSRAWAKTGNKIAARMAMIAITTSSSMSVNARDFTLFSITASSFSQRRPHAWEADAYGGCYFRHESRDLLLRRNHEEEPGDLPGSSRCQ